MTPAEVAELVTGYRVIRHRGQCFVHARGVDDVRRFAGAGAQVNTTCPGWPEVYLWTLLDEPTELDDDGRPVDNRREVMLDYFRERDGYSEPYPESLRV